MRDRRRAATSLQTELILNRSDSQSHLQAKTTKTTYFHGTLRRLHITTRDITTHTTHRPPNCFALLFLCTSLPAPALAFDFATNSLHFTSVLLFLATNTVDYRTVPYSTVT